MLQAELKRWCASHSSLESFQIALYPDCSIGSGVVRHLEGCLLAQCEIGDATLPHLHRAASSICAKATAVLAVCLTLPILQSRGPALCIITRACAVRCQLSLTQPGCWCGIPSRLVLQSLLVHCITPTPTPRHSPQSCSCLLPAAQSGNGSRSLSLCRCCCCLWR